MHEVTNLRQLRRGQIIAAARQIVVEQGIEALTFSALERRLAFTRGSITWHFQNKGEILAAVLQDVVDDIDGVALAAIRTETTLPDRARAVVREMVRGYTTDAGYAMLGFWSRLRSDPEAARVNAALCARYRGYGAELVRIGQARGDFRSCADPEAFGAVFVSLVLGIALQALFEEDTIDVERVVEVASEAVVRHLQALRP